MDDTINEDARIELIRTLLETIMLDLPADDFPSHKSYLGGYLECLFDTNQITEEQYNQLHLEYIG